VQEVRGHRYRYVARVSSLTGPVIADRRSETHVSVSRALSLSYKASSSAAFALKYASRPAMTRLPCSPSISALAIIEVIRAIASRASWALFGGSSSIGQMEVVRDSGGLR
jgi:hypothetical protein